MRSAVCWACGIPSQSFELRMIHTRCLGASFQQEDGSLRGPGVLSGFMPGCTHPGVKPGTMCPLCGKEVPKKGVCRDAGI